MDSKKIYENMASNSHLYFVNGASLRLNKCKILMVGCTQSLVENFKKETYIVSNTKIYKTK